MEEMKIIEALTVLEKLKCNTRHCWTSTGRNESIADHCWRLAVFAYLVRNRIPGINVEKLIVMCLIHDWGEAITGDIPTFKKTNEDRVVEREAVDSILKMLPESEQKELSVIFDELDNISSKEAEACIALDKLEGVLQHNEADIKTWTPLEYELQLVHGNAEVECSEILMKIREILRQESQTKISEYRKAKLDCQMKEL